MFPVSGPLLDAALRINELYFAIATHTGAAQSQVPCPARLPGSGTGSLTGPVIGTSPGARCWAHLAHGNQRLTKHAPGLAPGRISRKLDINQTKNRHILDRIRLLWNMTFVLFRWLWDWGPSGVMINRAVHISLSEVKFLDLRQFYER